MKILIKLKIIFLGLSLSIFSVFPVYADGANTYINGSLGRLDLDNDRQLKNDDLISIGIEHRYAGHWAAELFYSESSPVRKTNNNKLDLGQYGIDGIYYFKAPQDVDRNQRIEPYGVIGLGHADFEDNQVTDKETQLRLGLGLRYLLDEHWSLKADTRLIYSSEARALDNAFSIGLGFAFRPQLPAPIVLDSDGDGVNDDADLCPHTPAGVVVNTSGCILDSDKDGVFDYKDNCPETPAGVNVDGRGCALDSDGDGVPGYKDNCPKTPAGVKVDSHGCPLDTDSDGVADHLDECKQTPAGAPVDTKGCALDTDADGVADYKDNCPATLAGRQVDERGCKYVLTRTEEVTLKINFASNSSVIDDEYFVEIKKIANFLKKFGEVNTVIEGHTDDRGEDAYNTLLSKKRAEAVMNYLIDRFDIEPDRVSALGYGEVRPVEDNSTKTGRLANRRVVAVMKAQVSE